MTTAIRLAKRVIALTKCSRREAEQYIEGGWVRVDGEVVEEPQFMVDAQQVELDPAARLDAPEPATLLLHKAAGVESDSGPESTLATISADSRWPEDPSGVRPLRRHLQRLTVPLVLPAEASGLLIVSQDWRVVRKLREEIDRVELEFVVEVDGELSAEGMALLNHGLRVNHYALPPAKVSWQSDRRLRFAFKGLAPTLIGPMCQAVGLTMVSMKCLRVGRIPLAKLPASQWRYLAPGERI